MPDSRICRTLILMRLGTICCYPHCSLLGNAFPFIDFKVRVTRCRFRFNNEWYGVMQGARFTNIIERGFHHLFLPELFLSFPPSERGKLIPHSHSPNRAERHSAIILQLVPPIVSNTHKYRFCCPYDGCQRPDLCTSRPYPSMCLVQRLIEQWSNVSIRAPALSSSNKKETCSFMLPVVDLQRFTFHRSGKGGFGLGSDVEAGHVR